MALCTWLPPYIPITSVAPTEGRTSPGSRALCLRQWGCPEVSPDMSAADGQPFPIFQWVDVACPELDEKPKLEIGV